MQEQRSRFEAHWVAILRDLRGTGDVPLTPAQIDLLRREFLSALDAVWDAAVQTRPRQQRATPPGTLPRRRLLPARRMRAVPFPTPPA